MVVNRSTSNVGSLTRPGGGRTTPDLDPGYPAEAEQFREYAWKCANAGIHRDLFENAIKCEGTDESWRAFATAIRAQRADLVHPGPSSGPGPLGQNVLMDYFDLYAFAKQRSAPSVRLADRVLRHAQGIVTAQGWVKTACDLILTAGCRFDALSIAVNAHVPGSGQALEDARFRMLSRHAAIAAASGHRFWAFEPRAQAEARGDAQTWMHWESLWNTVLFHAKWMQGIAGHAGKYIDHFLADHVAAYDRLLIQHDEARDFLNHMYRYWFASKGLVRPTYVPRKDLTVRPGTNFEVDFGASTIKIMDADGAGTTLVFDDHIVRMGAQEGGAARRASTTGTLPPLPWERAPTPHVPLPPIGPMRGELRGVMAPSGYNARRFNVQLPVDPQFLRDQRVPAALSNFSSVLAFAFVLEKIRQDHEALGIRTLVELGSGLAGLTTSADAVYHAWRRYNRRSVQDPGVMRHIERMGPVVSIAERFGAVLGVGMDLVDGAVIIRRDDPDLQAALRRGDTVTADVMSAKGYLQFANGILGGVEFATAMAGATCAGPLGLVVIGLGVVLVGLEVAIWMREDNSQVGQFTAEVLAIEAREFLPPDGRARPDEPPIARVNEICRTAAVMATLNYSLRERSPFRT